MANCNRVKWSVAAPLSGSGRSRTQGGFTLVEVLVSSLILALGLVGVAGLQALALKNNQSAYMRSQASALAYDLADRMRTNVSGAASYDPTAATLHVGCGTTAGCTVQQTAQNDIAEWNVALAANLPMGTGFVCIDSTPNDGTGTGDPQCDGTGSRHTVKIWWDDDRDGVITVTAANTERLAINFQL
ncbi:MAG: type IV pilus modification protein PilV [Pseudomonadota bacterium]